MTEQAVTGQAVRGGLLHVKVVAQQRLALGTGSEVSYFTGTHAFVPGSVLRGALAAAWIAENGVPAAGSGEAARFRDLFDGPIRYGPLYVPGSVVVPVSARVCKYRPTPACEQAAVDAAFEPGTACPACGGPAERGKGKVELPGRVALDRITRTSIDPRTGRAADGELYAHGALPAGVELHGFIFGRDDWLEQPRKLRLGGRRTVGGAAAYSAQSAEPDAGQSYPGQDAGAADGAQRPQQDRVLVIRLTSPAIFVDPAGRPCAAPDPGLDLDGATVERSWSRTEIWTGWHAASRLPKPEELCAVTGSTYRLTGPPSVLSGLAARLPVSWLGLRRTEGFGGVQIVTAPWRPPVPAVAGPSSAAGSGALELLAHARELGLSDDQHRWLISALRDLQLALERGQPAGAAAGPAGTAAELADDLLGRPAAEGFSGRQRDGLRRLFAVTDPGVLRDLSALLRAGPAAGPRAEGGP